MIKGRLARVALFRLCMSGCAFMGFLCSGYCLYCENLLFKSWSQRRSLNGH